MVKRVERLLVYAVHPEKAMGHVRCYESLPIQAHQHAFPATKHPTAALFLLLQRVCTVLRPEHSALGPFVSSNLRRALLLPMCKRRCVSGSSFCQVPGRAYFVLVQIHVLDTYLGSSFVHGLIMPAAGLIGVPTNVAAGGGMSRLINMSRISLADCHSAILCCFAL